MRTKICGYLILAGAIIKIAIDATNGGGFDLNGNLNELLAALSGAGLVFLRDAISKISK